MLSVLEPLALAIAATVGTGRNLQQQRAHAAGLARATGLADDEVHVVELAALLQNIGMLGVPPNILKQTRALTPDEFQRIRAHPSLGAEMVESVAFPYPIAPLIRSHHERWDGKGYPAGLQAEQIPLGARILAVVGYFNALQEEQPGQTAMSEDAAIGLLQQERGKGLDPALVDTFVSILASLPPTTERTASVFDDLAKVHREGHLLLDIAQTLGTTLAVVDTMTALAPKLKDLVPFSCAALFLYDEETDTMRCRWATGIDADLISEVKVPNGEGLAGWVARNRRSLVNARPSADLDAGAVTSRRTSLQSALVCPLIFNERLVGTLSVYHTSTAFFRDDHRVLLDCVSDQLAAVINHSVLFEQVYEDVLTDALTGLPNSRFLFMHTEREFARAERLKSQVSVLVVRIDDFDTIRRSRGHAVGARITTEVAHALRIAIRPYDVCAYYASDEFIVVLAGCGAEEAEHKRKELRRCVDDIYFEATPGQRVPLRVSVGAAVLPDDGKSFEALLGVADARLFEDRRPRRRVLN